MVFLFGRAYVPSAGCSHLMIHTLLNQFSELQKVSSFYDLRARICGMKVCCRRSVIVSSPGLHHSIDILAMSYMSEREFIFVESKIRRFHCLLQVVSIPTGLNIMDVTQIVAFRR